MIKNRFSLLIILILTFSFLAAMSGEVVTVTQNIPKSVKAGSSFTIELTINKGAIAGFAKLQTVLPEGFTATVLESKTASFSFRDQKANFIWLNLPTETEFKISFRVNVAENAPGGSKNIDSRFSYLENNEKKLYQVPILAIAVESSVSGGDQPVATNTAKPATTTSPSVKPTTQANNAVVDNTGTVKCIRTIKPNPANPKEFIVDMLINKGDISKFAKLEESIPPGFFASGVQVAGGVFSAVDQKAKILWMALPPSPEFTITYKLVTNPDVSGKFEISGVFAYLLNDQTKKSMIPPTSISVGLGEEPITAAVPPTETTDKTNAGNNTKVAPQTTTNNTANTTNANQPAGNKEMAKTTGGPSTGQQTANNATNNTKTTPTPPTDQSSTNANNPRMANQTPPNNTAGNNKTVTTQPADQSSTANNTNNTKVASQTPPNNTTNNSKTTTTQPGEQSSSANNTNNPRVANQIPPNNNAGNTIANSNQPGVSKETPKTTTQNSGSSPAMANNAEKTTTTKNTTTTTRPAENTTTIKNNTSKEPDARAAKVTTMPAKSSGISYKVQIAATHKNVRKTYFQQKYRLQEPFMVETHEGWYKYTVNSFTDYKSAKNHRDSIQKNTKINGPFVVAYNDGKRITVQEALMISKQKWYK